MSRSTPTPISANFQFLAVHDPLLDKFGAQAERYFADDPSTSLIKLRQFGEVLAQRVAARAGLYEDPEESQVELLRRLRDRGLLPREIGDLFHELRKVGNAATHEGAGDHRTALFQLRMAQKLGVWFHRAFRDRNFKPGPFVPPPDPRAEQQELAEELARLRAELEAQQSAAEAAKAAAEKAALARLSAEQRAAKEAQEREEWEALAAEVEREKAELAKELAEIQAAAVAAPAETAAIVEQAEAAAETLELDEADTRRLIDAQLRAVGWEVDSVALTYGKGARPEKGRNRAIAEWPTKSGPADYVLFVALTPVGVVEAKRQSKDVPASLEQAKRYSRSYTLIDDQQAPGGPWGKYKIPFLFATNGRPYLRQLETKSGIWFIDKRRPQNLARALEGWYAPEGLAGLLRQDIDKAQKQLAQESMDYLGLRDYQIAAIRAVEAAIAEGQRECLVAMATGTGKTRTCIGLTYRLLKTRRFRRVLFLVDRSALGEQTANAYKDARLENLQTFTDIFDMKELGEVEPEPDTRLQIATIQGMVRRILYPSDERGALPVDAYDCIVVDECHRGYLLDREMSDGDLSFRDQLDYISKYRRVLDHFDAVKIGLTATPALHTTEIFGRPVFQYSYREAVIDGMLIDHEPPIRIITALAEDGIHWAAGEQMSLYDADSHEVDTVVLPDEVDLEVDSFNRKVVTENFNRVVCKQLAHHIDPSLPEKTIIFCATDSHADMVVELLKAAMAEVYGEVEEDAIVKITGASDKPLELIRRFKNERLPNIAVSVDLLSTGIDVPAICNVVFLRRVRSRILYEQMMGRATRRCDDIDKEVFRIYDAVDLYSALKKVSTMKPVVADPKRSFASLVEELDKLAATTHGQAVLEQLVAKFQARRRRLEGQAGEAFAVAAGESPSAALERLRHASPTDAAQWFASHPQVVPLLDKRLGGPAKLILSEHADELRRVERGYGTADKPADYLDSFAGYLQSHLNEIPALLVVTQRPRELTRKQLKELRLALDQAGYTNAALQTAWRETTNQDIAASIIGFIRQAALGDALVPYATRVDWALQKILASHSWSPPQRKWLERIAQQIKIEIVVDREALDLGVFKTQGGRARLNKIFDGKIDDLLGEFQDLVWQSSG
ncbi:MAG: type I restriction-modification system endonuclease [Enhygromyxa sp.]